MQGSTPEIPNWVEDAAKLPVAFAQVREDPWLDDEVVRSLGRPSLRAMLIASGGCTVAYLAARGLFSRIDVIDPNPAQIALARLKIYLIQHCTMRDRSTLLGHAAVSSAERYDRIGTALRELGLSPDAIGPPSIWAMDGPDFVGRYERVFSALRQQLIPQAKEIEQLLQLRDPNAQSQMVAPETALGQALDAAFDRAMDLPILVRLFGEAATRNRVEPFARHFARRTRHVLSTQPAADNPFLWQMLAGRYPTGVRAPWIDEPVAALPSITWTTDVMTAALRQARGDYDFIGLSNILDWLSADDARETLARADAALRAGGVILVRQLNSTLDIPQCGPNFHWETEVSSVLHARDRSFFYRRLHLGRKR